MISEIKAYSENRENAYNDLYFQNTWGWQQDGPMADDIQSLGCRKDPRYKVPKFYADKNLLDELFKDIKIIGITHVEDWGTNNKDINYNLHVRK